MGPGTGQGALLNRLSPSIRVLSCWPPCGRVAGCADSAWRRISANKVSSLIAVCLSSAGTTDLIPDFRLDGATTRMGSGRRDGICLPAGSAGDGAGPSGSTH